MKLITWNCNSIRQRLPRLLAMLERHQPDVVCLQETKVEDEVLGKPVADRAKDAPASLQGLKDRGLFSNVALEFRVHIQWPKRRRIVKTTTW